MTDFKVGDVCTCRDHFQCFFVPGSIVEIVRGPEDKIEPRIVTARLMFGAIKPIEEHVGSLQACTMPDGSVQCYVKELKRYDPAKEKVHDLET